MKTIFSILFFPILLIAQPKGQIYNSSLQADFILESVRVDQTHLLKINEAMVELTVTIEIYFQEDTSGQIPWKTLNHGAPMRRLPKYLSTFHLLSPNTFKNDDHQTQKRLNRMLAENNYGFPQENTLFDRLSPVDYENTTYGIVNIPKGFGPRILL